MGIATMVFMCSSRNIRSAHNRGFALVEVIMGAVLIGIVAVGSVQALGLLNRNATRNRVITNARAIVQRNIDTALSVTCTTSSVPAILAVTPATGTVYDDDGGTPNVVTIVLEGTTSVQLAQGVVTRIVTNVPTSQLPSDCSAVDVRRVTFKLDYSYRGQAFPTYSLSTLRAIDN